MIVEHNSYAGILSRYIHLNPVHLKKYDNLSVNEKKHILRSFKWSSYSAIIGLAKTPYWLKRNSCYRIQGSLKVKQKDYAEYVEYGLLKTIENPMEHITAQSILGSDSFIEQFRRKYIFMLDGKGCPQAKQLSSFMELENLASKVAAYYLIDRKTLFAKFQKNNEPRQVFLFLSKKYCRGRYPLIELAKNLGLTGNSYSSNTYKFQKLISNNKELKDRVETLIKSI